MGSNTSIISPIPRPEAYEQIISFAKIYPNKTRIFLYKSSKSQKTPFLEAQDANAPRKLIHDDLYDDSRIDFNNVERSLRRTRTAISDLVLCNEFDLFVTFTFKTDRQDIEKCKKRMHNWLHTQNKINKFKYLLIPEFHSDHKSIHFHGLLSGFHHTKLKKTNVMQKGRRVYNISAYKGGFTTAVIIDNPSKVSTYVKKYITKDMPQLHGKKRYWCSSNLLRPKIIKNQLPDPSFKRLYENDLYAIYESDTISV